ncbi:hypothetical protein PMZ80_008129 [Knufia obscura]|uniref:Uncharacterized protein n=2 Tax=Knufia TaxID=430999 RepID=A0AAN8FEW0_9EURO|nr:hypothetical protein PMZ80_008129 [Knufia obscura]KAK5957146.1 hypothetical protein OHC33_001515 [Knufia fluminis]
MASVIQTAKAGSVVLKNVSVEDGTTSSDIIYDAEIPGESLKRHPLGVRPSGNALTADQDLSLSMGIFGRLPDSLVLLLLEFLDQKALLRLSHTCKGLFAFATHDQIWRELALRDIDSELFWRGTWRSSLLKRTVRLPRVKCQHLYSDALYRPFQCTNAPLEPFTVDIPKHNHIPKLKDLSVDEFAARWSDKPFVLTEPVKAWKVFQDWNEEKLLEAYGQVQFRAEAVDWTLSNYVEYMNNNQDESPLYLFDRGFVEKMGLEVGEDGAYQPPECFAEDLFMLLGEHRPDHRWLIIGPERSGSTFHKDPNATSAWNAVIRGSKYWIMFPNSVTPPGVYVSDDQSEVTSPLSITEWLLTFHEEARQTPGCIEGICGPGEVLHVPSGWWHLVVNLEPAIAITQNFVPKSHLGSAINFLKNKPDQVSGFQSTIQNPYALFMDRLQEAHPDLYESMQAASQKKRKWEDVVAASDDDEGADRGGFSFGFGDDDLEDED